MKRHNGNEARSGRSLLRPALWILGSILVAFPIARAQLAEVAVANRMPGQALLFDAGHARALAGLAGAIQLKGEQQQAMTFARAALEREPMNVIALRTLGLALEQTGDKAGANRIMSLAARLGWRDTALQLWLVNAYAAHGDVKSALRRTDALARMNRLPEVTFPVFLASITDDALRPVLVQAMADRPLWRGNFFYRLLQVPANQTPYVNQLVADLAKAGSPINPAERAIYLARSVQVGEGRDAYAYWLRDQQAAGVKASALPWDGGFEHVQPPGTLVAPFEWRMSPESTGVASIVSSAKGGQLAFSPGRDFRGTLVSQTVVLQPGRYSVTARIEGDAASTGLRWTIRCIPDQRELPLDLGRDGAEFGPATFDVPAQGCAAQSLSIDVAPGGDAAGSGDVTIDDVSIRKIG
jgi:tetratricopeptide (TPR) repeat protein